MNVGVAQCVVVASPGEETPPFAESADENSEPPVKKVLTERGFSASGFQDLIMMFLECTIEREAASAKTTTYITLLYGT